MKFKRFPGFPGPAITLVNDIVWNMYKTCDLIERYIDDIKKYYSNMPFEIQ